MIKRLLAGFLRGLAPAVVVAGLLVMQLPAPAAGAGAEVEVEAEAEGATDTDASFDWVRQFGGPGSDWVCGTAVDTTGVYAVGWTGAWSPGQRFLRKYDLYGNELWTRDNGTCVAAGPDDRVFVGDFGCVRSFDPDGNEIWAVDINDDGYYYHAADISANSSGVYVGGTYWSRGSGDKCGHFVRKCDPDDGHIVWTRKLSCGPGDTDALGICATSGAVYFAERDSHLEVPGYPDFGYKYDFVHKYDADGNELWERVVGLRGGYTQDICADASGVYVTGCTSDAFIRKFDAEGNEVWTRLFGSEAGEWAYDISLYSGSIYVAGCTWGVHPGQTGRGGGDVFVCRYDTDGNRVWVQQLGSGLEDDTVAISVSAGGIYLGGRTRGAMPGCSSQGGYDAYLGRLAVGGILGTPGWEVMELPADLAGLQGASFVSIWGTSPSDVFALAVSGAVIHYDGSSWAFLNPGPFVPGDGVTGGGGWDGWGTSPSDLYVAGERGRVGQVLSPPPDPVPTEREESWREMGVFHYDGDGWEFARGFGGDCSIVNAIWGSSATDVFAVGTSWDAKIGAIHHYDGEAWSTAWQDNSSALSPSGWQLDGIWSCSSSDAFAVGSGSLENTGASHCGLILRYDGTTATPTAIPSASHLTAVWGSSSSDVYAVGCNGTIMHYDGSSWTPMDSRTARDLNAIWGAGPDVFAVGDNGTILRYCSDPPVTFADHNLEIAIRHEIQKYSGVLRRSDLAGLTALRDSGPPIRNLGGLEYCTSLVSLTLDGGEISDLSPLSGLTHLRSLCLSGNQISDISALSGLTGLEDLDLGYNQITDISPLANLTGLRTLHLGHNDIVDLSALSGLTGLNGLCLFENQISDLSPLSGLTALGNLALWNNQVVDISPLSGLVNLQELSLSANRIVDISPLASVKGLKNVYLEGNQIVDISPLCGLTQLSGARICNNRIREIPPLPCLSNLSALNLEGNCISDVSNLSGLTVLSFLCLAENQVNDVSPLSGLTGLKKLSLERNQVSDLSPLSSLTGLECLWLSENRVSDLSPLAGLVNLQVLCADDNEIEDVPQLSELTSLNYLLLDGNRISDVSPLTSLTGLWYLQLGGNRVSDFSPLASMPSLGTLYLDHNQISQLAPVPDFPALGYLDLSGNLISDVSPLAGLTSLPGLCLDNNLISDISPLSGLTRLSRLSLDGNLISDISPLAGLTDLTCLSLAHNRIADIKPLVDNPGLGMDFLGHQGDLVYLQGNPLSALSVDTYIPALLARGVQVFWDGAPWEAPAPPEGDSGPADPPAGDPPSGGTAPIKDEPCGSGDAGTATAAIANNAGTGGSAIETVQPAAAIPETAAAEPEDAGNAGAPAQTRLWVYPMAVIGGFLALSAAGSFAAWLRGRILT